MNRWRRVLVGMTTAIALPLAAWSVGLRGQTQGQAPPIPVPRPFPQPNQPSSPPPPSTAPAPTSTTSTTSAKAPAQPAAPPAATSSSPRTGRPTDRDLGIAVYPAADYLDSYDAGRGQRYYLFGTNAAYEDIVAYYRNMLHDSGHELFKAPAMQQFDLGKFRDDTMAYPPSVVVKDYTWALDGQRSDGYLFVDGTQEKRYKTVIQIVPATGK
jgi:hypothetical protein